jgi:signal transduction histidine kinase
MMISLVANDVEVSNLCREILSEVPGLGGSSTILPPSANGERRDADLHIWDFRPNLKLPDWVKGNLIRHLFLVDRQDVALLHERIGAGEGNVLSNVLLKPVSRGTLTTFLVSAISTQTAKSLRVERDEILQCLIQTNLKLQEYDQDRTTFLARAVHDFRAPLTALGGYCGLLLSGGAGSLNENQTEILRRIQHSAKRLSRMASAMFELSVAGHVKRRPEAHRGDPRICLEQALHEIAPFADEKSISIDWDLEDPGDAGLYFDAAQMEQVLINILDNACKFTPRGSIIEIRGYPYFWNRRRRPAHPPTYSPERRTRENHQPNSYRIDIADRGSPIPEDLIDRIFEEYTSYSGGRDRSGGGLGLAICRRIVAEHGGRIWAENSDSGPVFSFVLPLHPADSDSVMKVCHEQSGGSLNAN